MNAIIIDDNPSAIKNLRIRISKNCPDINIEATYIESKEALKKIRHNVPDLIFLDYEMPVINGLEFLEILGPTKSKIIFFSAYQKYAIKAFKFSAIDYLLKPVDNEKLKQAIIRAKKQIKDDSLIEHHKGIIEQTRILKEFHKTSIEQIRILKEHLNNNNKRIVIPSTKIESDGKIRQTRIFKNVSDINFIESRSRNSLIYFDNKDQGIASTKSLGDYEKLLLDYSFSRISDTCLLNISNLENYEKGYNKLIMKNGKILNLSDNFKKRFKKEYIHFCLHLEKK